MTGRAAAAARPPLPRKAAAGLSASILAVLAVAGLATVPVLPAAAQDGGAGRIVTFGQGYGVTYNDNLRLDRESEGGTYRATANAEVGLRFATPLQTLDLTGRAGLRAFEGPGNSGLDVPADPSLQLAYRRAVPDSAFELTARLRSNEVAFLTPLERLEIVEDPLDPEDPLGPEDPLDPDFLDDLDDLEDRRDEATRRDFSVATALELRRRAPLGVRLSAEVSGRRYSDTEAAGLTDETRYAAGVGLRFDLNEVTRATLDLRHRTVDEEEIPGVEDEDAGTEETTSLQAGITRRRSNGTIGAEGSLVSTDEGTRQRLSLRRTLRLPLWTLAGRLGATRGVDGEVSATGSLRVARDLPTGSLNGRLRRSVTSGSDDDQSTVTSLTVGYGYQLDRLTRFGLDLAYVDSQPADEDPSESAGSLGVSMNRALTEDWNLSVAYRHRFIEEEGDGTARDNSLSVTLNRAATFRY